MQMTLYRRTNGIITSGKFRQRTSVLLLSLEVATVTSCVPTFRNKQPRLTVEVEFKHRNVWTADRLSRECFELIRCCILYS